LSIENTKGEGIMKISKCTLLYVLIIFDMFAGSMNTSLTYLSLVIAGIIALVIGIKYGNDNENTCFGVILLLCFQNLCIGLGAHLALNTDGSLKFITQIPFMTIAIIWIVTVLKEFKKTKKINIKDNIWIILYFICIAISVVINRGSLNSILINTRNMTVFYMAYIIGKKCISTKEQLDSFYKKYIKLMYFVFGVGIILLAFDYKLYEIIGMNEVYIAKGGSGVNNALDSRFYTKLFSFSVIRMGSIYYEPVNLAYFFAFGFIMSLYYNKNNQTNRWLNIIISGTGLFLTYGKGGYMIVGLVMFFVIFDKYIKLLLNRISKKKRNFVAIVLMIVIVSTVVNVYIQKYPNNPAMPHIKQIQSTYSSIIKKPLGHGLGTGGNMGKYFNSEEDYNEGSGQESGLMSFLYQIGIQGVLCLFMVMKGMFNNKEDDKSKVYKMAYILPFVLLIVSLFQENTFTPQCIVIYMIFIGAMSSIYQEKEVKITRKGEIYNERFV